MRKHCAIVLCLGLASCGEAPPPDLELVQTCKAPWFRRTKEHIARHKATGQLYYFDRHGRRAEIAPGVRLSTICRKP